ncbi:helix-turn-helix domain-containing protein [Oceanobacillus salinisoli]|uniref:helix-turn-helix domain-containing protein n=1 Tax=Oceanobacillus salinisoli TaxID=2678611 RepID=UPI0012E2E626|nr:DUF1232 domain-containing protein [Oceanobacillus salinisoli]
MEDYNHEAFRLFLKRQIKEKHLSVRKLSKLSGVDHATISKMMNGKRKVNLKHLEKLAVGLEIDLSSLLKAAGYHVEPKKETDSDLHVALDNIEKLIESSEVYKGNFSMEQLEKELTNYNNFSQTEEGKQVILEGFQPKLNKINGIGPYIQKLQWMYTEFTKNHGTKYQLALMGSALLYFIVTTDLLPDYLFPVGYLDDALVVQTVLQQLENKK